MKKYIILIFLLLMNNSVNAQEHQKFTEVLKEIVKNGLVEYKNLENNNKFSEYLTQLASTNPQEFTKEQKLAFWINAYNAFTLEIISQNYPAESILDLHSGGKIIGYLLGKTVWDKEFIEISGKKYSLNSIEHEILRKMDEPRIHFAIVCASISCPELRNEAFEAGQIEVQMEEQTKKFLNDSSRNTFDLINREAEISEIFNWFEEDFGNSDEEILLYLSNYLPNKISSDIKENISKWDFSFKDYDWGLNEIKND